MFRPTASLKRIIGRDLKLSIAFGIVGCLVLGAAVVPAVHADQFDDQINTLRNQNEQSQGAVSQLQVQASSYQDAINKLNAQIAGISAAIATGQAKQASLTQQIQADQVKLEQQKTLLGEDLKSMYVNGQLSTVEMLATSKNLSDFVDAETYRGAVQKKIQDTLKAITALQNQLQAQKNQVEQLLADQKVQQGQLDADQAQQSQLLAMNQSQQDTYNNQIKNNDAQIVNLRAQQAAANAALFGSNGSYIVAGHNGNDTYPNNWRGAAEDSMVDNWGMYNRECVSYTAWKVYESGRHMPYGYGNANQWDDHARAAGIPVDTHPKIGDVAIKNSQPYGHAMYVEHVYADGAIYVSQYNQDLTGHYSEAYISAATVQAYGLQFIHF